MKFRGSVFFSIWPPDGVRVSTKYDFYVFYKCPDQNEISTKYHWQIGWIIAIFLLFKDFYLWMIYLIILYKHRKDITSPYWVTIMVVKSYSMSTQHAIGWYFSMWKWCTSHFLVTIWTVSPIQKGCGFMWRLHIWLITIFGSVALVIFTTFWQSHQVLSAHISHL